MNKIMIAIIVILVFATIASTNSFLNFTLKAGECGYYFDGNNEFRMVCVSPKYLQYDCPVFIYYDTNRSYEYGHVLLTNGQSTPDFWDMPGMYCVKDTNPQQVQLLSNTYNKQAKFTFLPLLRK